MEGYCVFQPAVLFIFLSLVSLYFALRDSGCCLWAVENGGDFCGVCDSDVAAALHELEADVGEVQGL